MVMIENMHHGTYLERFSEIRHLNVSGIDTLDRVYRRGVACSACPYPSGEDRGVTGDRAVGSPMGSS